MKDNGGKRKSVFVGKERGKRKNKIVSYLQQMERRRQREREMNSEAKLMEEVAEFTVPHYFK